MRSVRSLTVCRISGLESRSRTSTTICNYAVDLVK